MQDVTSAKSTQHVTKHKKVLSSRAHVLETQPTCPRCACFITGQVRIYQSYQAAEDLVVDIIIIIKVSVPCPQGDSTSPVVFDRRLGTPLMGTQLISHYRQQPWALGTDRK